MPCGSGDFALPLQQAGDRARGRGHFECVLINARSSRTSPLAYNHSCRGFESNEQAYRQSGSASQLSRCKAVGLGQPRPRSFRFRSGNWPNRQEVWMCEQRGCPACPSLCCGPLDWTLALRSAERRKASFISEALPTRLHRGKDPGSVRWRAGPNKWCFASQPAPG